MSDTSDCDTDAAGGTARDADPFGIDLGPTSTEDAGFALLGHVEQYEDAPDECTIFPRAASPEFPRATSWVTAKEGSYRSLEDVR